MRFIYLLTVLSFALCSCSDDDGPAQELNGNVVSMVTTSSARLSADMSLEEVLASGAAVITPNNQTYFAVGHRQVSANNQNPILLRYDNGTLTWARSDYETSGDDGTGRGLILDPDEDLLYVVFTATGTQGDASDDYRRFTGDGWQKSYGKGGGARVVVLAKIDASDGEPQAGTFVTAQLSNGNANTISATALAFTEEGIELTANSFFSPRKTDKSTFTCSGSSPFLYTIVFDLDLETALSASAVGCQ